ncbi:SDR family oxidoreductase [Neorhodopirellula pilleata]|uniref:NAD dependent epimerase/dehydratase family protein n=1 Tax=Neorhodopirellula pilleata TaxID=2714738 RepID=A0A5C5ZZ72_9BACT|nr:SDR family oxidoreductase [Neorhodopirellula pilleata]TWT92579.1 NAD dependent epimerase/dehydratase family protein [Neorhodopirellula pilleata]
MNPPPRLLVVGCGYLGMRVGQSARSAGWFVAGTTRNRRTELENAGILPIRFDWNDSRDLDSLGRAMSEHDINRIVIAVSHDRNSHHDRFASQVDGLSRLLQTIRVANPNPAGWVPEVVYISTTGVFHQTDGVWVDETSPTHPTREGGRAHLQAEAKFRSQSPVDSWSILRLSGIYGPGRVPRAADVQAGRPIASPPTGHLNLIHVQDAAEAVIAALSWKTNHPNRRRENLYLVSDDRPVIRREFYREIARQTGSPEPTFVDPESDSGVRFRSETDKRIWNRRLKRDLLPRLAYPTYREGLQDVLTNVPRLSRSDGQRS